MKKGTDSPETGEQPKAPEIQNSDMLHLLVETVKDYAIILLDPEGRVLARGKSGEEDLVLADLDLAACRTSTARRLFWKDRRPELYGPWLG